MLLLAIIAFCEPIGKPCMKELLTCAVEKGAYGLSENIATKIVADCIMGFSERGGGKK